MPCQRLRGLSGHSRSHSSESESEFAKNEFEKLVTKTRLSLLNAEKIKPRRQMQIEDKYEEQADQDAESRMLNTFRRQ